MNNDICVGARVLLLEDDALINMSTTSVLEEFGCRVQSFLHMEPCLRAASAEPFDVAVLDVNVSGGRSYPVADRLRARGIPVVFLTGYESEAIDNSWRQLPTCRKPCSPDGLRAALVEAMHRGSMGAARELAPRLPDRG
jgi:DNA-binding response OmpR family regulator